MAKGDFIFAGVDAKRYGTAALRGAQAREGEATAGLTVCALYVSVELSQMTSQVPGLERCACLAKITDYRLQVNAYVDREVVSDEARLLVTAHELEHVARKRQKWEKRKASLESLFDYDLYECGEYAPLYVTQTIYDWLRRELFSGQATEEREVRETVERRIRELGAQGKSLAEIRAEYVEPRFPKGLVENAKQAAAINFAPNFRSIVFPTFQGSC